MSKFIEVHLDGGGNMLINANDILRLWGTSKGSHILYVDRRFLNANYNEKQMDVLNSYEDLKRQLMGVTNDEDSNSGIAPEQGVEDLKKARWYLDRLIGEMENKRGICSLYECDCDECSIPHTGTCRLAEEVET